MNFLVSFEGRHFESSLDGVRLRVGFDAKRRVEALSIDEIDAYAAIENIFAELATHATSPTPESKVRVVRVRHFEPEHESLVQGFRFFAEGSMLRRLFAGFGR